MARMNSDELAEFYRLIGSAIWHIQYLEDALVNFLVMKLGYERRCAGEEFSLEHAQALLLKKRRMTFGPLLDSCFSRKVIRPEHMARFTTFREERHWLVHRSVFESGDGLYQQAERRATFERIDAIREESILLKKIVATDLEAWSAAHGVDTDAAAQQAQAAMQKLRDSE